MSSDFNHQILAETAHRPWPMPDSPWIMTQTWHDLLFAHWPVDVATLRPLVPNEFGIDLYEGQAWCAGTSIGWPVDPVRKASLR